MGGRKIKLEFLDDQRDPKKAVANMRGALANPSTVAVLGLANSATAKVLFETAGKEIRESGVPFISDLSVNSLFADYANVFTTRASQETDSLPILRRFLKDLGVKKPAFIGVKDAIFSTALADGLKGGDGPALVADHRLTLTKEQINPEDAAAAVRDLKEKGADFIFLSVGSARAGAILRQMMAAGVRPPVFVSGRIESMQAATPDLNYSNDIHHLAWDGLPDAFNERLRQRIARTDPARGGSRAARSRRRQVGNPVSASRAMATKPRTFCAQPICGRSALARSMATWLRWWPKPCALGQADLPIAKLRRHITGQLLTAYADGHGTFRGNFENWSFNPTSRAASRTPLLVTLKGGQGHLQLAPLQYVRLRNDILRPVQTYYLDIDMLRTFKVDDNEKSFMAEFYLSMHHQDGVGIDKIEFTNAFLDPATNARQISVRTLHDGGPSVTYPADMRIYRVSGKFQFEPRLSNYPFDMQRFSIDLQPKLGDAPFIIQPPPLALRDQKVDSDGWEVTDQYAGYDEDFIRLIDARSHEKSVVPFYKGSFVWVMRRQANDYYQRVVVPLAFILAVAYLSIFIPRTHFEAVITIQVTALLSAVALYLALPKIDADTATFSDRIFLFVYLAVSVMIAISIARVNPYLKSPLGPRLLALLHIIGIPLMVLAMATIVASASVSDGHSWTAAWKSMTGGG